MNRKLSVVLLAGLLLLLASFQSGIVSAQDGSGVYGGANAFHSAVPGGAAYTYESRLGTFRQGMQAWGAPVYRVQAGTSVPLVSVTNTYSGRVENWPIPTYALPASGEDGHLAIINLSNRMVYELYAAVWLSPSSMQAGGMVAYSLDGNGVTDNPDRRVTASGVANTNGMIIAEDFLNGAGQFDASRTINHALSIDIPFWMIAPNSYVAPAVGGEEAGTDTSGNGVPMGARFALPRNLNVDSLNVHPFTREILRAARDYGLFVVDATGTPATGSGQAIGTLEVEPGLIQQLYGVSNDDLIGTVQSEVANVIASYGVFRVTVGGSNVPMPPAQVPTQIPAPTVVPPVVVPPVVVPPVVQPPVVVPPVVQPPVDVPPVVQPPVDNGNDGRGHHHDDSNAGNDGAPAEAAMSVQGSGAVTASTTVAAGSTFTVYVGVGNAVSIYGAVMDCTISPDNVILGQSVVDGGFFSGDMQVNNQGFSWPDYFYYTVQQSTPMNGTGAVVALTMQAGSPGTATMTCENYAIDRVGNWVPISFIPMTITVQ